MVLYYTADIQAIYLASPSPFLRHVCIYPPKTRKLSDRKRSTKVYRARKRWRLRYRLEHGYRRVCYNLFTLALFTNTFFLVPEDPNLTHRTEAQHGQWTFPERWPSLWRRTNINIEKPEILLRTGILFSHNTTVHEHAARPRGGWLVR